MKQVAVYFDSWASKWVGRGEDMDLAKLEGVTIVNLAFAKPDLEYWGGKKSFIGTGLEFSQDFGVVIDAIKILRGKGVKVMLSVGGGDGSYNNWGGMNRMGLAALVHDLGCDGIDIDWEVGGVQNFYSLVGIICQIHDFVPGKISIAAFSTGAYGSNGVDTWMGSAIPAMVHCKHMLDWINIMAYDAGSNYDPIGAYDCYRIYYPGDLLLGFEVGPPGWGGYLLKNEDVARGIEKVRSDGDGNGIFVWSVGSNSTGTLSPMEICSLANKAFK